MSYKISLSSTHNPGSSWKCLCLWRDLDPGCIVEPELWPALLRASLIPASFPQSPAWQIMSSCNSSLIRTHSRFGQPMWSPDKLVNSFTGQPSCLYARVSAAPVSLNFSFTDKNSCWLLSFRAGIHIRAAKLQHSSTPWALSKGVCWMHLSFPMLEDPQHPHSQEMAGTPPPFPGDKTQNYLENFFMYSLWACTLYIAHHKWALAWFKK